MTILVLGGRGKTAIRLAPLLEEANIPFLLASRSTSSSCPYPQSHFDWEDEATHQTPFTQALSKNYGNITAAYIVAPPVLDIIPRVIKFIDFARAEGVKRFVFVSASILNKGDEHMGQVHEYLASLDGTIEWVVLRPTWFMENFSEDPRFANSIKNIRRFYTCAGDGRMPFVSLDDVARVAFRALTDDQPHNTDHILLGPETLSHDQVATILTQVLREPITHANIPQDALTKYLIDDIGMDVEFAQFTAMMDETIVKTGSEDRLNNVIETLTGVPPRRFEDYVQASKHFWT